VDRLLASPEHATRLARWWEDVMLGAETKKSLVDRGAFRRWLEGRFASGVGWDVIVRELVTATGPSSAGGNAIARMTDPEDVRAASERSEGVNGAVNWILRHKKSPQDVAGAASRAFLGVQIQCAQCHDHKTETWKQADFESFAATFARVDVKVIDKGRVFDVREGDRPSRRLRRKEDTAAMASASPRALDGSDLGGKWGGEWGGEWTSTRYCPEVSKNCIDRASSGRKCTDAAHFTRGGSGDDLNPLNVRATSHSGDANASQHYGLGFPLRPVVVDFK